jgi:hypothetical protein
MADEVEVEIDAKPRGVRGLVTTSQAFAAGGR